MDRVYVSVKCDRCGDRSVLDTTSPDSAVSWLLDQERAHRSCGQVSGQLRLIQ